MSQEFKIKFEENKDSVEADNTVSDDNSHAYSTAGNIRNLAFVWPDGKMQFLNYSYLVSCVYDPKEECILMEFTTHSVELKGYKLNILVHELMASIPRLIFCTNDRYRAIEDGDKPVVNSINVTLKT